MKPIRAQRSAVAAFEILSVIGTILLLPIAVLAVVVVALFAITTFPMIIWEGFYEEPRRGWALKVFGPQPERDPDICPDCGLSISKHDRHHEAPGALTMAGKRHSRANRYQTRDYPSAHRHEPEDPPEPATPALAVSHRDGDRVALRLRHDRAAIGRIIIKVLTFPWRGHVGGTRNMFTLLIGLFVGLVGVSIGSVLMTFVANVFTLPWGVRALVSLVREVAAGARQLLDDEIDEIILEQDRK